MGIFRAIRQTVRDSVREYARGSVRSPVQARRRAASPSEEPRTAVRHLGHCSVCGKEFKVWEKRGHFRMVHHGFQRPGGVGIVGDCFGVDKPPYELSPEGCVTYRDRCLASRLHKKEALGKLERREHELLYVDSRAARDRGLVAVRRDVPEEAEKYERERHHEMDNLAYDIKGLEHEATRMERKIAAWKPAPLAEWREEVFAAAQRTAREERVAILHAKREAKAAKARVLADKRTERENVRRAIRHDFCAKLEALAREGTESAKKQAFAIGIELQKKKYKNQDIYARDLACDGALFRLGFAVRERGSEYQGSTSTWVSYKYPFQ